MPNSVTANHGPPSNPSTARVSVLVLSIAISFWVFFQWRLDSALLFVFSRIFSPVKFLDIDLTVPNFMLDVPNRSKVSFEHGVTKAENTA